jgi:hypothetical protein
MNRLLLTLAAASALWAQAEKTALIEVKYTDAGRLGVVLAGMGLQVSSQPGIRGIVVRGAPEAVAAAEEAVKKLDVPEAPAPNVELTVYLLYGAAQESTPDAVPQDLQATVKQLRSLFAYKSYRVMESFVQRGRDGQQASLSGTLPASQNQYQFSYRAHVLPGSAPRMIRIDALRFTLRFLDNGQFYEAGINTDLDTREGQKVVVGKSNVRGTADAVLLVVTPKVVE